MKLKNIKTGKTVRQFIESNKRIVKLFGFVFSFFLFQTNLFAQPELRLTHEGGMQDETVTVKLTAKDFTNINRLQFSMTWSIAVIEFQAACVTNLPGLSISDFDYSGLANGRLTLDWNDPTGMGVTRGEDEVLLAICYKVVGNVGTSTPVNLVNNPVQTAFYETGSTDPILPTRVAGSVTVLEDQFAPLQLSGSVEEVTPFDNQTCVQVTAENFDFLQNLNLSLAWEPTELLFTGIQNFNLDNLDQSDFDLSTASTGRIGLNWSDLGASVPDGTVLFEVCYTAIAFPGTTTPIRFEDNPTAISATHQNNRPVSVETRSGAVQMKFQPLNLMTQDTTVDPQERVCISLNSEYFSNITELDLTLNWDPSVLTFDAAFPYGLLDFTDADLDYDNTASGILKINWTNTNGVFFPDFENFLDICFVASGTPGSSSDITITNDSKVLASYSAGLNIGVEMVGGTVIISDFFAELVDIVNTTCTSKDLGAIDLTVQGGVDPLTIQWDDGENSEDRTGLSAGIYSVTVTDSSVPPRTFEKTYEVVLDDVNAPIAEISGNPKVDCINSPVMLDGQNSSSGSNYVYRWETSDGIILSGVQTVQPTVQGIGTYTLLVTDNTSGCCSRISVELEEATPPAADAGADLILNCYSPELNLNGFGSTQGSQIEYDWTTQNGQISSGEDTQNPLVEEPGDYRLIVTDSETSCKDTAMVSVAEDFEYPLAEAGDVQVIKCDTLERTVGGNPTSTGSEFIYQWTTRRGYFAGARDEQFAVVNAAGVYILSVQNTRNGCITKDSIGIFGGSDLPFISLDNDTLIDCRNTEIVLDGTNAAQGSTFEHYWYTFDGNIVDGWNTMTPTIDRPGTYAYEVYDRFTNCRNIESIQVAGDFETPILTADRVRVEFPCNTDDLLLVTENQHSDPAQYIWSTLDGDILAGIDELTVTVGTAGTYRLEGQNIRNGCTSNLLIEVTEPVFPEGIISTTSMLDCSNQSISLDGAGSQNTDQVNFSWQTDDGNIVGTDMGVSIIADAPGSYDLILENGVNGCIDTTSIVIEKDTIAPLIDLLSRDSVTCVKKEIDLDASGSSDGDDFEFLWETMNGHFIDSTTLIAEVDAAGTYVLTVQNVINGCISTDSIVVFGDTLSPVIVLASTDSIGCSGELQLDASGSDTGDLEWTVMQGGNIVSGENTLTPTIDQPGIYELTITDSGTGCSASAQTSVSLSAGLPIADAGADFSLCEISGGLSADLPVGLTGNWSVLTAGASLENTDVPTTDFIDLENGNNLFVWTLSSDDCPNFDADTVRVNLQTAPVAVNDSLDVQQGMTVAVINVFNNDVFNGLASDLSFNIISRPQNGVLEYLGDGELRYQFASENASVTSFEYEICSVECPDLCSSATVKISFDGLEILNDVPNVITPNGDGLNDELFFEAIGTGNFPDAELLIFNRWGDEVFRAKPYLNDWTGVNNSGSALPHATYYYVLKFDTGGRNRIKGHVTVMD